MNPSKKKSFSLAESLISLMLLVLTVMLTMASITRKLHHPTPPQKIKGMFACWNEDNIVAYKCDGNHCENESDKYVDGDSCKFILDRRVTSYRFFAAGSRYCKDDICVNGEVNIKNYDDFDRTNENDMKLKIKLGDKTEEKTSWTPKAGDTTITKLNGEELLKAIGGLTETVSKVIAGNVKNCKIISTDIDGSKHKCKNTSDSIITIEYADGEGYGLSADYPIESLKELGIDSDIKYEGKPTDSTGIEVGKVKIKLAEKNSYFKAKQADPKDSELYKQLRMLPDDRMRNLLVEELLKYYRKPGAKNGVVVITW